MLGKKYRLHLRTERNRVTSAGQTIHSALFTIITAHQTPPSHSLYAVITSTKLHPHSVERHRIKRLVHQILKDNLDSLPQGRDIIIIPKKPILSSTKDIVANDLLKLLKLN